MFPRPPGKIIAFKKATIPAADLERQFDEHARSIRSLLEFLRTIVRDDGQIRNGKVGPEQLTAEAAPRLAQRVEQELDELLSAVRTSASEALVASSQVRELFAKIETKERQIAAYGAGLRDAFHEIRGRLAEVEALALAPSTRAAPPTNPVGVLGPYSDQPGFYGADQQGAASTAQDYAVTSQAWAEYMPGTIPGNILAINAVTGDHWSSRWWANKSAGAFGMMAWWYQGAYPQPGPPTTPNDPTGNPLPIGAMYYDTTLNTMMVWTGSGWENTFSPQAASTASLYYLAGAGQVIFPLGTHDLNGASWAFNQTNPEGLLAMVNGVRLAPTLDFTVAIASSTVTFVRPVAAGSLVIFDILVPKSQLAPTGTAVTYLLNPLTPDGVTTVFHPTIALNNHPINTAKNEELAVNLDGVTQQPGAAYTTLGNTLTFAEAPSADAKIWIVWFGPVGA